jgi:hypothetical protein
MPEDNTGIEALALPTIFEYAAQVYQAMLEEANQEVLGAAYGEQEGLVYDGFTTKLIRDLGLPTPYYTKILKELKRLDCIRQLRRGGSTTTSRWVLLQAPTPELFHKMPADNKPDTSRMGQLEQRVRDLSNRVNDLEKLNETP